MVTNKVVKAVIILTILICSSFAMAGMITSPEDLPKAQPQPQPQQSSAYTKRINLANNTYVDMKVEGNVTTLTFSDGTIIVVKSYTESPIIEFYTNDTTDVFSRFTYSATLPTLPVEFDMPGASMSSEAPGLKYQKINRSSGTETVETELIQLSLTSSEPGTTPSIYQMYGDIPNDKTTTVDSFFDITYAINDTNTEFELYSGEDPREGGMNGTYVHGKHNQSETNPNQVELGISDIRPDGTQVNTSAHFEHKESITDSFFDIFTELSLDRGDQQHQFQGNANPSEGAGMSWTNETQGVSTDQSGNSTGVSRGGQPVAERWPHPDSDPTFPFGVIDVTVTDDSVGFDFDGMSIEIHPDKAVINFFTDSGIYLPIVIYFITLEVVIVYEYITITVFLEIIELVYVIVIYEVIKIEVYITYILLIIEIIEITIVEILIKLIEVNIILIQLNLIVNIIDITINIKINVVKKIIIQPIRIVFVPIPVFIRVFVPIFIPVPTPVPYVIPHTDVDLAHQKFDEDANTMDLSYNVTDEYDRPVSNAKVTVKVTATSGVQNTYNAVEDSKRPGIYHVNGVTYQPNANIYVVADPIYRPNGTLRYTQERIDAPPTTVNKTVTNTTTVTSGGTGTSQLQVNNTFILVALMSVIMIIPRLRRKKEN